MSDKQAIPPETPRYNRMLEAIDACHAVDEAEQIADPIERLRAYVRMAQNTEPERQAAEIAIRAHKRMGKLLKAAGLV